MLRRPLLVLLAALALWALAPAAAHATDDQPRLSYPVAGGPLTITPPADGSVLDVRVRGFKPLFSFCLPGDPCPPPSFSYVVESSKGWDSETGPCTEVDDTGGREYQCATGGGTQVPSVAVITGSPVADSIESTCGFFSSYSANVTVNALAGDDLLTGGCSGDEIAGGDGVDVITGNRGTDGLVGGPGRDDLSGGAGVDELAGGPGRDVLSGGADGDTLAGDDDGDRLDGGDGDDGLDGGAGADFLLPGLGKDTVTGGANRDAVSYEDRDGSAPVAIRLDGSPSSGVDAEGDTVGGDVESAVGSPGADTVVGNGAPNDVDAGAGNDVVDLGPGADVIDTGDGDDTIAARDGAGDSIDCGGGADGVTGDELDALAGCEAADLSRELMADVDNDGVVPPLDCDDRDPNRRVGLPDVPGDGVDQDCVDGDAPFPRVVTGIQTKFRAGKRTKVLRLRLIDVLPQTSVELRCLGRKCPFKGVRKVSGPEEGTGQLNIRKPVRKFRFRPRQRLEIRILAPRYVGKVNRQKFARNDLPTSKTLCLPPTDGAKIGKC